MIDYLVAGSYLLLMVAIGIVFRRFNSDEGDYFRSGCKGTWWLVGSSIFMSAFSAWTFTGAAGLAYEAGWTAAVIYLANTICLFINFLFLGAWFRQLRVITTPQIIEMRFGLKTRTLYAWVGVLMSIIYSALFLYGLAIFSSSVFGFGIQATIVALGIVVVFYCTLGGSWGVMATDFLQSLIILPMTIILAGVSLWKLGGFGNFLTRIDEMGLTESYAMIKPEGTFPLGQFTLVWCVAMLIKSSSANLSLSSAVRFFAVKDGWEARKASLLACILMAAGAFIWIIPPMAARLLYAEQVAGVQLSKPSEAAYAIASVNMLPAGMSALMVMAMFAATMSSMDTGINRSAAIIIKDILPAIFPSFRKKSHADLLRFSMSASLILGSAIILLALYFSQSDSKGIFEYMLNLGAMLNLPMAIPMILGLFVKRAPGWAAAFSVGITFFVGLSIQLFAGEQTFQEKVFINSCVGTGAFIFSMLFWKRASAGHREQVQAFYDRMHTPVDFEKEVGNGNDASQLKILGIFAVVMGCFVTLLVLIPNSLPDRLLTLSVAGFILAVGIGMILTGQRQRRSQQLSNKEKANS
jgi:SSS family transporter